jgi:lysophospholipase
VTTAAPADPVVRELTAADGTRLRYRSWPAADARAHLLVSHGLGEHGGRYAHFATDLSAEGFAVHALDHRGHGLSGGARGHVRRFTCFVDDFEAFRRAVAAELPPGAPVFLLGQSMGGLIALRWLQAHPEAPVRGAVLASPLLRIALQPPRWKVALSGLLSRVAPALPFGNEIDPDQLSTDAAVVAAYRADPQVHARITPRLYTEMLAAMDAAFEDAGRIAHPLLFLVPGADRIVDAAGALRLARTLRGDVTVREYPQMRHEPLNEVGRAEVVADVLSWTGPRIDAAK